MPQNEDEEQESKFILKIFRQGNVHAKVLWFINNVMLQDSLGIYQSATITCTGHSNGSFRCPEELVEDQVAHYNN